MNTTMTNFDYISNNRFVQIAARSEEFILPCLLLIGTTCNTLTFVVMRRGRMRHSSSCFYMAALAIADTFVLWIGCFNRWLELLEKQRPILACNMCCKSGTFAFFLFADCSVWITVAMTFERYIAVSQPLRASQICTIKRARYILLNIFMVFFLINVHFLWTFHLSSTEFHCIPLNQESVFLKYFTWFDSFKYSFCPFTLLITLNILIIKSLLNARNKNKLLEQQTTSTSNNNNNNNNNINSKTSSISSSSTSTTNSGNVLIKKLQKKQYQHLSTKALAYRRVNRRLTTMLLTVSFAFCICSMPISIMQLIDAIYSDIGQRSKQMNIAITIGKIVAEISQYVNHSSNFFLYAFTGRIFRHELWRLFTCSRYRFFSTSSQRLRHRAKKMMSFHNPTQGLHEHFYSHGRCHTKIVIAPKHLLKTPDNDHYRESISSTYSFSHMPVTKQSLQYQNEKFLTLHHHLPISKRSISVTRTTSVMLPDSPSVCVRQRTALVSFVEKIKDDQTTPLFCSSTKFQTIKPYGLTDTTPSSM
ncbi:unnamed protein product [Rotaria socialis]|uniref:G-protein coupled receptors family 1 profile domain-containing protein n=1 Tax=Rotaria socialis TaxID=392032 RepID=A0A817ZMW5_9BILA|nr:unnamed protein product [Rotaria socialis]CAF4458614.1 unnamed protein product [Rotaria socialis]